MFCHSTPIFAIVALVSVMASSALGLELIGISRSGASDNAPSRPSTILKTANSNDLPGDDEANIAILSANYRVIRPAIPVRRAERAPGSFSSPYPWKANIITTVFWIGEDACAKNPVANHKSSWDGNWRRNFGGLDTPDAAQRVDFRPKNFVPGQNPFYIALPYNDITRYGTKAEAPKVIPWFAEAFERPGQSVLKGRWIAIRKGNSICYAQWEDVGPFRTDHAAYVFGDERPKPNANKGAGLDVSPAIRDYLGLSGTDVTDWRFVEVSEVPDGPWKLYGENNPFVTAKAKSPSAGSLAKADKFSLFGLSIKNTPGTRNN